MQNNRSNIMCTTQISQDILQPNQAIIQNRKAEEEKTDTSFFPIQESTAYRKDETKKQAFRGDDHGERPLGIVLVACEEAET